ncbi:hypothetical protein EVAR_5371_1 [Eumeta japonica]|uniref:Uncharacterized protein n=1 Tax=Eumeta variegata TaxID=151549 RepID=A0A4C1TNZ7_EUMVA|nr:hypothetical protein EVAR_5371_1 [Eumeta japonica]
MDTAWKKIDRLALILQFIGFLKRKMQIAPGARQRLRNRVIVLCIIPRRGHVAIKTVSTTVATDRCICRYAHPTRKY